MTTRRPGEKFRTRSGYEVEVIAAPTPAPGEFWANTCGDCGVWLQGGRSAWDAHRKVVHGE